MPTKTLLFITIFFFTFSANIFAEPSVKKQSVESSLTGDSRWKSSHNQSAESIIRDRQHPEERQHMKRIIPAQTSKHHYRSPSFYEQQRLKEKHQNNPPIK